MSDSQEPQAPATYQELVQGHPVLKGTKAKAISVGNSVMIGLVDAECVSKLDIEERQAIVTLVTGWARSRFPGKYISGVVLYDASFEKLMATVSPLGATLTTIINHRRWPDRWSKDVISE